MFVNMDSFVFYWSKIVSLCYFIFSKVKMYAFVLIHFLLQKKQHFYYLFI